MDYTWIWIGWGIYFGIFETLALLNKKRGDTLSETIWRWFAVQNPDAKLRKVRVLGLLLFMVWLLTHFVTGGWV